MNFAATSVFETANWKLGSAAYEVTLLSEHGGPVTTSLGNEIQTLSFKRRTFDTLIVAGGIAVPAATPVEKDLGAEIARVVAKILVVYHRRAGGQSQFSTLLDLDAQADRVQTALTLRKRTFEHSVVC
jgi:transcriptional regulator GlxA family with amidase domain